MLASDYQPSVDSSARVDTLLPPDAPKRADTPAPLSIDGGATNAGARSTRQTTDGKDVLVDPLHSSREVTISRERTLAEDQYGRKYVTNDQLVLSTGRGDDKVDVSRNDDGSLSLTVNGELYDLDLAKGQELTIRSGAGNDTIDVDSEVTVNVVVDGGAGNDVINTGSGDDRVDGGAGNDTIYTGAGSDDVFGNTGNDRISAGDGNDVVYGGDGADQLYGQAGDDYLEGGEGNDLLYGDVGNDVLSGGLGDDAIESHAGDDKVYAGQGKDLISNTAGNDTVYAQTASDQVSWSGGARSQVVNIEIDRSLGSKGVKVEGSDAFRQRVEADIEFLRSSPNGQQMLAEYDAAAAKGNTVTIRELQNENNGFTSSSGGQIVNGRASAESDATISYNPAFHEANFPASVVVLYHEMSHAYNAVTGTFLQGDYAGPDRQDVDAGVPNDERQAVGLETTAPAYDFDHNPATPPTTHNPAALTENGIRAELGLPPREHYAL